MEKTVKEPPKAGSPPQVILACYTRFEDYVKADRPWNAKAYYYEYTIDW